MHLQRAWIWERINYVLLFSIHCSPALQRASLQFAKPMKAKPIPQHTSQRSRTAREQIFLSRDVGVCWMSRLEDPSVQPKDHTVPRATPLRPRGSRARAGEAAQAYIDTEVIRIWPGALLHVWVDRECFPQAEVNVWNLLPWEDTEANYLSTFKKDRHIKEELEDQRRPWESRKVENKCKVSFVRESGYFLCSDTGLTDQNRSSLVQYYALAVDSTSYRKKLLHHSCLATYHHTSQLHPVHWLVSFSQDVLLRTEPVRKHCLVRSPVALKLCYSLIGDPTQISDLPLPFLLKHHPPTAMRAPPHRAEEQQRTSQHGCNSWEKGSKHCGTSQCSVTSSLHPNEYP